jgi:hypothetical protein
LSESLNPRSVNDDSASVSHLLADPVRLLASFASSDGQRVVGAAMECMPRRRLGKTGYDVSSVGLGTWSMGCDWGPVDDERSLATLHPAADAGTNLLDAPSRAAASASSSAWARTVGSCRVPAGGLDRRLSGGVGHRRGHDWPPDLAPTSNVS